MQGTQEKFDGFPHDNKFWAVKFIDQFGQAHRRSRTPGVQVMLQLLDIREKSDLLEFSVEANKIFLGQRRGDSAPEFDFVTILAGALPKIKIGDVYHNREKVGELPSTVHRIVLAPGESDSNEVQATDAVEPLPGWAGTGHCRILNRFEYSGLSQHAGRQMNLGPSRFSYFKRTRRDGGTDTYVVPRMTIFKAFYAPNTAMANAFCNGPWSETACEVISFAETYGGLKTGVSDDGHQWDVVLQTSVRDDFAGLVAVLYFDDYARSCAESIYTRALQDRGANPRAPWFASARIPIHAETQDLDLSVKCIQLHSWRNAADNWVEHRKFLVPEICGVRWPRHYPVIGHTRTNAGDEGVHLYPVPLPAPYHGNPVTKDANEDTVIRSDLDANKNKSTTTVEGSAWGWLGEGPQYRKLEKERSKRYEGGPLSADTDGSEVSPGARTSGVDALPKAEITAVIRPTNTKLNVMHQAFQALETAGFISNLRPVVAREPGQRVDRAGLPCWAFIDDESLRKKYGPSSGFRTVRDKPYDRRSTHWRSALILRFDYLERTCHWIEIECVRSDSFRSVLLAIDGQLDVRFVLETALDTIAHARGKNLEESVPEVFRNDPIDVFIYTHRYNTDGSLRIDLLRRFIQGRFRSK